VARVSLLALLSVVVQLGGALVLLVFGKLLLEWALALDVDDALFSQDNTAIGLASAGWYFGLAIILVAALGGPSEGMLVDLGLLLLYGGFGVLLLAVALWSAPRVLLPKFDVKEELVRDRNAGAGLVLGAGAAASGAVVAAAMQGNAPGGLLGGLASMTGTFVVAQLSLGILVRLHRLVAHFDVHDEIREGNTAAACTLAGALLGNGLLLHVGWRGDLDPARPLASLLPGFVAFGLGVLLMPMVRLLVSRLWFSGIGFDREIASDKNLAAGVLELVAHPALAALLVGVLA
jgi:uncharacterized membrane protein YjfL (UPF0719 family)